jgi:hypothetical protein
MELLLVDSDANFGVVVATFGGSQKNGNFSKEDLNLTSVLFVLHVSGKDAERVLLGAISRQKVEAVVHVEGKRLVVEGSQLFGADPALGGEGASGDGLQSQVGIVSASLHGEDKVEWVGNANLRESNRFFGLVDDQVEAGGFTVEENTAHNREAVIFLLKHILLVGLGALDSLDVGPQEDLQVLDDLLLSKSDFFGNIVVLHLELNLINSLGLEAGALTSIGQLGARGAGFHQLVALSGGNGLAAEFLLFVGNLGASENLDGGLGARRPAESDFVNVTEINQA